eukprot:109138-Pleurochrysis_carterae.AAC.1
MPVRREGRQAVRGWQRGACDIQLQRRRRELASLSGARVRRATLPRSCCKGLVRLIRAILPGSC